MRYCIVTCFLALLLTACAGPSEEAASPVALPEGVKPSPCANRDREGDYQRAEILRLNKGYSYHAIAKRAAFVTAFNAMPPASDKPVPDVAGYFTKPGERVAILLFATGGCVSYLEVVSADKLLDLLKKSGN